MEIKEIFGNNIFYSYDDDDRSLSASHENESVVYMEVFDSNKKLDVSSDSENDYDGKYEEVHSKHKVCESTEFQSAKVNNKKGKTKGRRTKISNQTNCEDDGKSHSKKSVDNIRRKVKVQFIKFLLFFLNVLIKIEWKGHQKSKFRTLDNSFTKDITIKTNKTMYFTKVRDLFTLQVSDKFKCVKDQNKLTADSISSLRPDVFNPILDLTVGDFYKTMFCGNKSQIIAKYELKSQSIQIKEKKFPMFFEDYCHEYEQKDVEYLKLYKDGVTQFFKYFLTKTPRNRNKQEKENNKPGSPGNLSN